MKLDILLKGCTYLTPALSFERNMDVGIRDGKIVWISSAEESIEKEIIPEGNTPEETTPEEVIDCRGKLLLPGFTDAHTHSCQQLLRGKRRMNILCCGPGFWYRLRAV